MNIHKISMSKKESNHIDSNHKIMISEIISPNKLEESWID
jgi:hypothetical protein